MSKIRQKPQSQDSLTDQLSRLVVIAGREGLYDAADFVARALERRRAIQDLPIQNLRPRKQEAARVAGLTLVEQLEAKDEKAAQGKWVPACGGKETVTLYRTGRRLLYVWQASTGRHAYLDVDTDMILSDEESRLARGDL